MTHAEFFVLAAVLCLAQAVEQEIPFSCGTHGGGIQRCTNNPSYTCTDCGYTPCVDINQMCWSCYGSDNRCYPYVCSDGQHCGVGPCDTFEQNATVTRASEAQIMSAIAARQTGAAAAAQVMKDAPQIVGKMAAIEVTEEPTVPFSCGTHGGGTQRCANNPSYTCTDCGYTPCVDVNQMCWSCYGSDNRCYPYVCSDGQHCGVGPCDTFEQNATVPRASEAQIMSAIAAKQKGAAAAAKVTKEVPENVAKMATIEVTEEPTIPFSCGTHGGGTQRCANNPSYTCTDCGYTPCVDINHMCWSCYGSDNRCYPYACSDGQHCGVGPCDTFEQNATVPRASEAQIMSAIAAKQKGAAAAAQVMKEAPQIPAIVAAIFTV